MWISKTHFGVLLVLSMLVGQPPAGAQAVAEKWLEYEDATLPFTFSYPAGSHLRTREDTRYRYIRVQKVASSDGWRELIAGEYYLEIFFFDPRAGHKPSPCSDLKPVEPARFGVVTARRGIVNEENPDRGGIPFSLCVGTPAWSAQLVATEKSPKGALANRILDSFRAK